MLLSETEKFELSDKAQEILNTFSEGLYDSMNKARDKAFSDLADYLRSYGLEDLRANTLYAAQAIVADVVSGSHYLGKSWAIDLTQEAAAIRDYLWKNYADVIVKAELVAKDAEIARLKGYLEERNRF